MGNLCELPPIIEDTKDGGDEDDNGDILSLEDEIIFPFDTQELFQNHVFPNLTSEYLRSLGTSLDEYAFGADGIAEAIVDRKSVV